MDKLRSEIKKMKFFVAFAALVAVTIASPLKPSSNEEAQMAAIVAAIQSPSTDPATAALLEQQLNDLMGFQPVQVGPAIVETPIPSPVIEPVPPLRPHPIPPKPQPISVGPAVIPLPVPEAPSAVSNDVASSSLVQIIVNINQASAAATPVATPVVTPVADAANPVQEIVPSPVNVVDNSHFEFPVQIVDGPEIVPTPVHIVDQAVNHIVPIPVANIPRIH
ncbi:hypothetical protein evm_010455 [Chilo suppressalis]|nr:hypothetical protein evm_010455 [Chilo suppressalis]